jgi:hypothetical protein
MTRRLVIAALALAVLFGVSQLVVPSVVEHRIESRLTDGGGNADVSVSGFPAVRLLFGDGKRIAITGDGLDLGLEQRTDVFGKLDGFDQVDVHLRDFRAGPFSVASFDLTRTGPSAPYHLVSNSRTTPGEIASYGAERLGIPGGPLLGFFTQDTLGNRPIPIAMNMGLRSDGGRIVVVSGGGTVAGFPTGPLAELITSAISVQI